MKHQILKMAFLGFVGACVAFGANAAPTVKKLGTTNVVRTGAATTKTDSGANAGRVSSVRVTPSTSSAFKAVAAAPKATVKTTDANAAAADGSAARLSLGKYLNSANVVKSSASAELSTHDSVVLRDRVTAVEGDIQTIKQDMSDHAGNNDIHVTVSEKEAWNAKQDELTAGDGISIENSVISADMKVPVGSETGPRTASIWVE